MKMFTWVARFYQWNFFFQFDSPRKLVGNPAPLHIGCFIAMSFCQKITKRNDSDKIRLPPFLYQTNLFLPVRSVTRVTNSTSSKKKPPVCSQPLSNTKGSGSRCCVPGCRSYSSFGIKHFRIPTGKACHTGFDDMAWAADFQEVQAI